MDGTLILLAAATMAGTTMAVAKSARAKVVRRVIGGAALAVASVGLFDPMVGAVAAAGVVGLIIGGVERTERRREAALLRARAPFEQPSHVRAHAAHGPQRALIER